MESIESLEQRIAALTGPDCGMESFNLPDLLRMAELQSIQDTFADAMGVAAVITDVSGRAITRLSNFSPFCEQFVHRCETDEATCILRHPGKLRPDADGHIRYGCLGGRLWGGGTGLYVGERHVANWLMGQVLDETYADADAEADARRLGVSLDRYRAGLSGIARMSRDRFEKTRQALGLIAGQLSRMALQNVRQARSICERERAEAALAASEQRYRSLFENSPISLWEEDFSQLRRALAALRAEGVVDLDAYLKARPDALRQLVGLVRVVNVNRSTLDLFEADDKSQLYGGLDRILPESTFDALREELLAVERGEMFEFECVNRTLSGREINVLIKSSLPPGGDDAWERVIVSVYDRTRQRQRERERKRMESRLLHAQKMEAVATLAGGVAHEFNNALFAINGNLELLESRVPPDEKTRRHMTAIFRSSKRMAHLTAQLLAYAQGGGQPQRIIPVNRFIREVLKLIQHAVNPDILIETDLTEDLPPIKGDYMQFQMALSAVMLNAAEAEEGRGDGWIRVATRLRRVAADDITEGAEDAARRPAYHPAHYSGHHPGLVPPEITPGDYVCIHLSDNGKGMDEQTRQRLFDPFFTTKFQGRGLGMAAVYGIIRGHGGWIGVDSMPGEGTHVEMCFPAAEPGDEADFMARPDPEGDDPAPEGDDPAPAG